MQYYNAKCNPNERYLKLVLKTLDSFTFYFCYDLNIFYSHLTEKKTSWDKDKIYEYYLTIRHVDYLKPEDKTFVCAARSNGFKAMGDSDSAPCLFLLFNL